MAEDQAAVAHTQLNRLTAYLQDLDQETAATPGGGDPSGIEADREVTRRACTAAQAEYDAAVAAARAIQAELLAAGDAAARALYAIPGAPYQPPNLFQQAWDRIDAWVDDHADTLRQVSGGLKIASAVAGVLSFIPVLTPIMAPIATATAVTALAIDAVLVVTGNGSVKALAVDAALMALPGAGRLASRAIQRSTSGLRMAKEAVPEVDSIAAAALKVRPKGARPRTVSVLKTRDADLRVFPGASRPPIPEGQMHPRLREALAKVPPERWVEGKSGKCAEIKSINDALLSGADLDDSVIITRYVRPPGHLDHGQPKAPCLTCKPVLRHFGITWYRV